MYNLDDFFNQQENRMYIKYESSYLTPKVFYFLCEPVNIYNMIETAKLNRPALEGVIPEIEKFFETGMPEDMFKQMIGRMVKFIIRDFGCFPLDKIPTLKRKNHIFKSGLKYSYDESRAIKKIKVKYEII
ncbi:hypothetical protein [Clostridium uliginosum]|uniref:Uncharacterized protein n=1 Tax=Clostridium uliginosum TaxID=119641 RepID=A0A1I1S422_9CLOT|nr:hypothetical protein [Clostridium uliginosum]SFD41344.1 hypothetical protein SAMN05421842_1441 [Clostridium uliginosum]